MDFKINMCYFPFWGESDGIDLFKIIHSVALTVAASGKNNNSWSFKVLLSETRHHDPNNKYQQHQQRKTDHLI